MLYLYQMKNAGGTSAAVTNYGARLVSIKVFDRAGQLVDVCLGKDTGGRYLTDVDYLGSIVGRYANRIKNGRFTLDGSTYQLAINNGTNHLHGGPNGYSQRVWKSRSNEEGVFLTMHSPDGDEGYPGNLTLNVHYSWSDDNALTIDYDAVCDQDTPFNVTNHAYFNLNGEGSGSILSHELLIHADQITELDDSQAPTGRFLPVDHTPFDFRVMREIGTDIDSDYEQLHKFGTYDHNFVLNGTGMREAAVLQSRASGIRLTCQTDQPGMQLYVANNPLSLPGKGDKIYDRRSSVCLETQHFPDSVNHENFPSAILHAGEHFRTRTVYAFSLIS
jgi:aldose 1-epimerase